MKEDFMEIARTVKELLVLKFKGFKQEVSCLKAEDSIIKAFDIMKKENIGAIPIIDNDYNVVGIFTERDIIKHCYQEESIIDIKNTPLKEVMTKNVQCASPDYHLSRCIFIFLANKVRHLPVIDDQKKLIGILSVKDVLDNSRDLYIHALEDREK